MESRLVGLVDACRPLPVFFI